MTGKIFKDDFFDLTNLQDAMRLILTPEGGCTTEQRWHSETSYMGDMIIDKIGVKDYHTVLDYGCGIGRMAKYLIAKTGCRVVGVDKSPTMRRMAVDYVGSDKFTAAAVSDIDTAKQFDKAICVWVLQHCEFPSDDIGAIKRMLAPNGDIFIANNDKRVVPCEFGFYDDGVDVAKLLADRLSLVEAGRFEVGRVAHPIAMSTWWSVFLND